MRVPWQTGLKIIFLLFTFAVSAIPLTKSSFTSQAEITGNTVSTGYWENTPTETPTVTPTPTPGPGDVVINEVMWMGSSESTADEWIELRNTTDHEIDIGQWTIDNTRHSGPNTDIMIPASKSIPAHGFFLLGNYPETSANSALNSVVNEVNSSLSLHNADNGNLILRDQDGNLIDQALGSLDWAAGVNFSGVHQSMERNDTPGDGLLASNWHTCTTDGCKSTVFWDSPNSSNYGTPGAGNLSGDQPAENPQPALSLTKHDHSVSFTVNHLQEFIKLSFVLTYDTKTVPQGAIGEAMLNNQDEYQQDDIILGSCSSGGTCEYSQGVNNIKLTVTLTDQDNKHLVLEKSL